MNAGAEYQAQVIASVYVNILTQRPLAWFGPVGQMPIAVLAETHGPGDDVGIEFSSGGDAELQARHQMNAGHDLTDLVAAIRARTPAGTALHIGLVIGRPSSQKLRERVRLDLNRLRDEREDGLCEEVSNLLADPANRTVLERLFVIPADFEPSAPEREVVVDRLRNRLEDPDGAEAAWDVLVADALTISATEGRRTGPYLQALLQGRGHPMRAPEKDERWIIQLTWIKEGLLHARHDQVGLELLEQVERELKAVEVSAHVRAETARLRAVALRNLDRAADALAAAQQAVALDASWAEALITASHAARAARELPLAQEFADRAIAADSDNAAAWGAKALAAQALGLPLPTVPMGIADRVAYRKALLDRPRCSRTPNRSST